nr:immunoglobulin heavy chain junction region [Mus musculus]MBK4187963.1 immunoglobulin heavy chain junction region [Mus musculus]
CARSYSLYAMDYW